MTVDRPVHTPAEIRLLAAYQRTGSVKLAAELLGISKQTAANQMYTARRRAGVATTGELVQRFWKAIAAADAAISRRTLRYRYDDAYREKAKAQARKGMQKKRDLEANALRQHYDRLLATQGNICAICGTPEGTRVRRGYEHPVRLSVDHDPKTGAIRELLCAACNLMLGYGKDDADRLQAGADYLRKHAQVTSHKSEGEAA